MFDWAVCDSSVLYDPLALCIDQVWSVHFPSSMLSSAYSICMYTYRINFHIGIGTAHWIQNRPQVNPQLQKPRSQQSMGTLLSMCFNMFQQRPSTLLKKTSAKRASNQSNQAWIQSTSININQPVSFYPKIRRHQSTSNNINQHQIIIRKHIKAIEHTTFTLHNLW